MHFLIERAKRKKIQLCAFGIGLSYNIERRMQGLYQAQPMANEAVLFVFLYDIFRIQLKMLNEANYMLRRIICIQVLDNLIYNSVWLKSPFFSTYEFSPYITGIRVEFRPCTFNCSQSMRNSFRCGWILNAYLVLEGKPPRTPFHILSAKHTAYCHNLPLSEAFVYGAFHSR